MQKQKFIHEVRTVKNRTELANIVKAQRISEQVLRNILKTLKTVVTEIEVANFIKKSTAGEYACRTFHRVEDWVTQGGDPKGNGTGGGDQATELSDRNFAVGAVGVARAGDIKVSNADQFFICKTDCTFLNNQYTYFGKVTTGIDVVGKIQIGDKISSIEIK